MFSALLSLFFFSLTSYAQYAPPQGEVGSTAIFKDSTVFIAWASSCKITRGFQDISAPSNSYTDVGDSLSAVGMAGINGVLSLGDGGSAILKFNTPITNGTGFDFAVFENSFDGYFLELAFVEVSSDGIHFFRFPAISLVDTTVQTGTFGLTDATKLNNLAGKYRAEYGTPFDLADLPDNPLLNKQNITHVKVIDVIGCIQNLYCSRDANLHIINDPWPTAFGSGGFDLDAIGVIHCQTLGFTENNLFSVNVYPNPANEIIHIQVDMNQAYDLKISNLLGETIKEYKNEIQSSVIIMKDFISGVYFVTITNGLSSKQVKIIKS